LTELAAGPDGPPPAPQAVAASSTAVDSPPKAASLEILIREDIAVDSLSIGLKVRLGWDGEH
jgi:hypothetical protein